MDSTSAQVGELLASVGLCLVIFQLFLYEPLITRYFNNGVADTIFKLAIIASIALAMIPFASTLSMKYTKTMKNRSNEELIVLSSVLSIIIFYRASATSAFSTLAMIVNKSVATNMRGTINGLIMTAGSIGNAMGPILGSILYASAIDAPAPIDGRCIFFVASLLMVTYAFICHKYLRNYD